MNGRVEALFNRAVHIYVGRAHAEENQTGYAFLCLIGRVDVSSRN